jgi:hypothetical protein
MPGRVPSASGPTALRSGENGPAGLGCLGREHLPDEGAAPSRKECVGSSRTSRRPGVTEGRPAGGGEPGRSAHRIGAEARKVRANVPLAGGCCPTESPPPDRPWTSARPCRPGPGARRISSLTRATTGGVANATPLRALTSIDDLQVPSASRSRATSRRHWTHVRYALPHVTSALRSWMERRTPFWT